jgi:hypothetical protein
VLALVLGVGADELPHEMSSCRGWLLLALAAFGGFATHEHLAPLTARM